MPPRRFVPAAAADPLPLLVAPPPPSPLIQRLRTDWRWAGISQFVWTFSDAFGLLDWDIETLEADLDRDKMNVIPDLIAKMLYALTYNRQINRDNAFEHLRKQYAKRAPSEVLFGTEEEPRQWAALGLGEKVQVLWDVCEWQMVNPARFRALLKSEEEAVSWRIEPVGWDKEGNTYFLFDDNRLWVKRRPPLPPAPPRQPKTTSQKAKKAPNKRSRPANNPSKPAPRSRPPKKRASSPDLTPPPPSPPAEEMQASGPRKRTQVAFYGNPISIVQALKRGGPPPASTASNSKITRSSSRGGLAAAIPAETSTPSRASTKVAPTPSTSTRGTRATRRTKDEGDGWQPIPAEWLEPETSTSSLTEPDEPMSGRIGNAEAVEESELSSLTDEGEALQVEAVKGDSRMGADETEYQPSEDVPQGSDVDEDAQPVEEVMVEDSQAEPAVKDDMEEVADDVHVNAVKPESNGMDEVAAAAKEEVKEEDEIDEMQIAIKEFADLPEGFVEWEAVCVTLYDWRTFPERFAKSRDPDEKNLYSLLVNAVGPAVIQALVEKEQEKLRQEAITNRKRSSRIATKELEKEEIMRREKAQREMEERMERSRRDENSNARAELNAVSQEKSREDRLKEREERMAARETAAAQKLIDEQRLKDKGERARLRRQRRREGETVETSEESEGEGSVKPSLGKRSRISTPVIPHKGVARKGSDEGWELDCEICRKTAINPADGSDVVSCDGCGKWQHTACRDKQDASEGRPKRNWDKVDFMCKECRRKAARKRQRLSNEPRNSPFGSTPPITNGHPGVAPPVNFYPSANGQPSVQANGHRPPAYPPSQYVQMYANQPRPSLPPISAATGYAGQNGQYPSHPSQLYQRPPAQQAGSQYPQYQQHPGLPPLPQAYTQTRPQQHPSQLGQPRPSQPYYNYAQSPFQQVDSGLPGPARPQQAPVMPNGAPSRVGCNPPNGMGPYPGYINGLPQGAPHPQHVPQQYNARPYGSPAMPYDPRTAPNQPQQGMPYGAHLARPLGGQQPGQPRHSPSIGGQHPLGPPPVQQGSEPARQA